MSRPTTPSWPTIALTSAVQVPERAVQASPASLRAQLEAGQAAIDAGVIDDVERKIKALPGGARHSVRPVLIYDGELAPSIKRSDAFCRLIPMADLLTAP